jgi:hypothetical protein
MDEPVHPTKIHERSEVHDAGHDARSNIAFFEVRKERLPLFGLLLLKVRTSGEHHVVAIAIQFDDLGLNGLTDEWLQIADAA